MKRRYPPSSILHPLFLMLLVASVSAQTTQPATTQPAGLAEIELRANTAFEKGDYAVALPQLMKLARAVQDQPQRLGAVQEKIRVCQKSLAGAAPMSIVQPMPSDFSPTEKMTPEERKKHQRPKDGQAIELAIKELGNFQYDPEQGGNIPDDVKQLAGCKLRTHGFMIPMDQATNISEFALVPSLFACCFGQPPQIQHTLVAHCPKGKAVSYYPDELVVEGILKVEEKKEDGMIVSVFELDVTSVKPAAK